MKLQYQLNRGLPKLAWRAQISPDRVQVTHGPDVEIRDQCFVEGAWNGRFNRFGFLDAQVLLGSGGIVNDQGALFATATNTLDRLYMIQPQGELVIANSMALALLAAGDDIDRRYTKHVYDLIAFMHGGFDHPDPTLPTKSGKRLRVCCHCNIRVGRDLSVQYLAKTTPPAPDSYQDYYDNLARTTRELAENATDPQRVTRYRPMATVSSGYDSPACAALARDHAGCTESLTFVEARSEYSHGTDDSGEEVAKSLGLSVRTFRRDDYLAQPGMPSAEFLACGGLDDVVMRVMEPALPGTLLFTGDHGDVVWNLDRRKMTTTMKRTELSGVSMGEFRLRVGFIRYPVPFSGCVHHPKIYSISESAEMQPWAVPGAYNRPIPRRMAEDAGVPRELFGQKKMAATVVQFAKYHDLNRALTAESLSSFRQFESTLRGRWWGDKLLDLRVRAQFIASGLWVRTLHRTTLCRQWAIERALNKPLVWRVAETLRRDRYRVEVPMYWPMVYHMARPPGDALFLWGLHTVMRRYADALRSN